MTKASERNHTSRLGAPASSQVAVTPNDDTDLPDGVCKALEVTVAGNLVTIGADDTVAVTRPNVAAGTIIPVRIKRVKSTGTSATVVALY